MEDVSLNVHSYAKKKNLQVGSYRSEGDRCARHLSGIPVDGAPLTCRTGIRLEAQAWANCGPGAPHAAREAET